VVSGIFKPAPASYFLMRRSHDGYISATGMFKATFPYAEVAEEEAERNYIKSLPTTSADETAGNVWIPPTHALELAEEYGIAVWIRALLDPTPIEVNNPGKDATPKTISPPPTFLLPTESLAPPPAVGINAKTGEALRRSRRSVSPSKIASPTKKIATPRKKKIAVADSHTSAANKSLQQALKAASAVAEDAVSVADTEESKQEDVESVSEPKSTPSKAQTASPEPKRKGRAAAAAEKAEPKVTVHVDKEVEVKDDVETTHTHVEVEMPAGFADLPLPEDTEAMIAKAKEMVEAAVHADAAAMAASAEAGPSKGTRKSKRKVEEVEAETEGEAAGEGEEGEKEAGPAAKRVKVESELKKERVKTRALIGISATLAIGYVSAICIPIFAILSYKMLMLISLQRLNPLCLRRLLDARLSTGTCTKK
jgi:hypothetical protein